MGPSHLQSISSSIVKPIGLAEFVKSLANVLRLTPNNHHGQEHRFPARNVGLAISGGVDSMALALLCSQLQKIPLDQLPAHEKCFRNKLKLFQGITFHAFVADHGVREGSAVEANAVANLLRKYGIQTEVLRINWGGESPVDSPNFESLARKHRFQTLGEACKRFELNALLLAHHQDDQAETVFMRMASGHRVLGLTGIRGDSEIPECYGIHGVHESGGIDNAIDGVDQSNPNSVIRNLGTSTQLPIEYGGVRLYRPLLNFSKARLRATCEEAKMEWFEDHTNKNPTLTMRNAVRHMYSSHTMPPALTKPALLDLSQRCKDKAAARLATMTSWLAKCSISRFETRVGILGIEFLDLNSLGETSTSRSEQQHIAASLLRKIVMLVTPEEHVDLSTLNGAVLRIFPQLSPKNTTEERRTSFTVASVLFDPQPQSGPNSWLISRQPYSSITSTQPIMKFTTGLPNKDKTPHTPWRLYDGRFWIRFRNISHEISIRPFGRENLKPLLAELDPLEKARLQVVLKTMVPGNVRWTLPAVFFGERIVALPTLGFKISDARAECEVRYKKVDLVGLPLVGGVNF